MDPGAAGGPMVRLVHISDLHCAKAPHDRLGRARDAINRVSADIIVVTGANSDDLALERRRLCAYPVVNRRRGSGPPKDRVFPVRSEA